MENEFKFCPHCGKTIKIVLPRPQVSWLEKPTKEELKKYEIYESTEEWIKTHSPSREST